MVTRATHAVKDLLDAPVGEVAYFEVIDADRAVTATQSWLADMARKKGVTLRTESVLLVRPSRGTAQRIVRVEKTG
jgi:hypothetical protein